MNLGFEHAEIPHPEFSIELQHGAVKNGVTMIWRSRRSAPQHGIGRMFLRRDRRDRDIVPEGNRVVIEGEEHLFGGVEACQANREKNGEKCFHEVTRIEAFHQWVFRSEKSTHQFQSG